jgi:hypothetical protein
LLPNIPQEIDTLRRIAESLLKVELGRWALINGGYIPEMPPPEPGSIAEKVSKLDDIDRNLFRTAATHVIEMIEENALRLQAEADMRATVKKWKPRFLKMITHVPRFARSHHLKTINLARSKRSHHLQTIRPRIQRILF